MTHGRDTPSALRAPAQAQDPTTAAITRFHSRWDARNRAPSDSSSPPSSATRAFVSHPTLTPALDPGVGPAGSSTHVAYPPALPPLSRDSRRAGCSDPELCLLAMPLSPVPNGAPPAHVNGMPPEILAEIFMHTLPPLLDDAKPNRRCRPLVISHVCRYWRHVAINLPALWQRLSLEGCPSKRAHRRLEFAQLYADRTRGTGMVLEYSDYEAWFLRWNGAHTLRHGLSVTPADRRCYCVLDFIISHIAEIRVLELSVVHASCRRLAALLPGAASMLREISVQFLEGGEETQVISHLYATSPQLVHLSRQSFKKICSLPLPVDVPWHRLVSAHIHDSPIPHSEFLDIIAIGQSLAQLDVCLCPDANQPSKPLRTPITQTCLQSLIVCADEPLDAVLQCLRFPSLREVGLRSKANNLPAWPCNDARILQHFVQEISGGLDVLEISEAVSLSDEDLIALLQLPQTASLTTLHVCGPLIRDTFFTLLNPAYGPPLAPDLTKLIVGHCVTTDGTIADMIVSRRQHHLPLHIVDISYHYSCQGQRSADAYGFQLLEEQYGMAYSQHDRE